MILVVLICANILDIDDSYDILVHSFTIGWWVK